MAELPMDIRTACIAAHEEYVCLRDAGFTHPDALYLIACILTGGPKPPTEETGDTP